MQTRIAREKNAIKDAISVLKAGGIIIYPTETSYGIGCDATNPKAIKKIFKLKRRGPKSMLTLVADEKMAGKYAVISSDAKKLIKKFMPGPLSLVCVKKQLPNILSRKTVCFRISSRAFPTNLVKKFGRPIVSTSANVSGRPALYNISDVVAYFYGRVDMIVDGGNLQKKKSSTVFDCISGCVLRKGNISDKDIFMILKK